MRANVLKALALGVLVAGCGSAPDAVGGGDRYEVHGVDDNWVRRP